MTINLPYEPFSFVTVPMKPWALERESPIVPFECPRFHFKTSLKGTNEKLSLYSPVSFPKNALKKDRETLKKALNKPFKKALLKREQMRKPLILKPEHASGFPLKTA